MISLLEGLNSLNISMIKERNLKAKIAYVLKRAKTRRLQIDDRGVLFDKSLDVKNQG
jgi:hypothetical protein